MILIGRHRREPHLPIELVMIRRYQAGRTIDRAGFSLEFVLAPDCGFVWDSGISPFDDDLVAFPGHAAERAVRVHQMKRAKAGVHHLATREEVSRWLRA